MCCDGLVVKRQENKPCLVRIVALGHVCDPQGSTFFVSLKGQNEGKLGRPKAPRAGGATGAGLQNCL